MVETVTDLMKAICAYFLGLGGYGVILVETGRCFSDLFFLHSQYEMDAMGVSLEAGLGGRYHECEDMWEVNRNKTALSAFTLS
jgi:hypothetical protein